MSIRDISAFTTGVDTDAPLKTLHHSHEAILAQLRELAELPGVARTGAAVPAHCRFHRGSF